MFLDATYCEARVDRRMVSQAVVVATGVTADGRREVLGFAVGDSEDGPFWTSFLRSQNGNGRVVSTSPDNTLTATGRGESAVGVSGDDQIKVISSGKAIVAAS